MFHPGVVLREGDYAVVGRDGLQVGVAGRHLSPEGLFGHSSTAMSLCSPERVVVAFALSAFFVGGAMGGDGILLLLFGVLLLCNGGGIGLLGSLRVIAASYTFSAYALI